jgi:hypothetical protein
MTALALLGACAALFGCGGDDDDDADGEGGARIGAGPDLERAYLARSGPDCRFPEFGKPQTQQIIGTTGGGKAWQVVYLPPRGATPRPGETTNVMIVEESPKVEAKFGVEGGQTVTVAGRSVSLAEPSAEEDLYLAQWITEKARYTVLADGNTSTVLERFIACLP